MNCMRYDWRTLLVNRAAPAVAQTKELRLRLTIIVPSTYALDTADIASESLEWRSLQLLASGSSERMYADIVTRTRSLDASSCHLANRAEG